MNRKKVLCLKFGEKTELISLGFFSYFWRYSNIESKSGRISGILLLDFPDIRLNQYPVNPYPRVKNCLKSRYGYQQLCDIQPNFLMLVDKKV
jgi:hypothetical protein